LLLLSLPFFSPWWWANNEKFTVCFADVFPSSHWVGTMQLMTALLRFLYPAQFVR